MRMLVERVMFVPTLYCFTLLLALHPLLVPVQCADKCKLGASNRTNGQWPFMASIRLNETGYKRTCSATVLNDDTLLTAAQCLTSALPRQRLVYIGDVQEGPVAECDLYPVVKFLIHPKYDNSPTVRNDIAMMKLGRKIDARLLKKVCLAVPDSVADGEKCVVPGMGQDLNQQAAMPIVSSEKCSKEDDDDESTLICTSFLKDPTESACDGNCGGPLLCPTKQNPEWFIQFGVNSFSAKACDKGPSYQTKVSKYVDWIAKNAEC